MNPKFILMDIEGTTTSISFVHETLFPYSKERMEHFVTSNADNPAIMQCLAEVKETIRLESDTLIETISSQDCARILIEWIDQDRKHGSLKRLQGMIWREGYETGAYTSHIYDDVPPMIKAWVDSGIACGIYSSGSVEAQRLLFKHTKSGDLTPYLSAYFDTKIGAKRESNSYASIARQLERPAGDILFLSDVAEELDAAQAAGMQTTQLVRPGTAATKSHNTVTSFTDLSC